MLADSVDVSAWITASTPHGPGHTGLQQNLNTHEKMSKNVENVKQIYLDNLNIEINDTAMIRTANK